MKDAVEILNQRIAELEGEVDALVTAGGKQAERMDKAMGIIESYGGIDGDHHKTWVIDQVARVLKGGDYYQWVIDMCAGEDGPDTYHWDDGIAP